MKRKKILIEELFRLPCVVCVCVLGSGGGWCKYRHCGEDGKSRHGGQDSVGYGDNEYGLLAGLEVALRGGEEEEKIFTEEH